MYCASWSGGKDSCFACYQAIREGYAVTRLVNFLSKDHGRVSFHGTDPELIMIQADLAGMSLYQKKTTMDDYEREFKEAIRSLKEQGAAGMVFGDIYLDEHREWVDRVCGEIEITPIEPLWGSDTERLLQEFIASGFQAVIVTGKAAMIEREWIGRPGNMDFLAYVKSRPEMDACGEKGEYHTLVTGGPLFRGRIEITDSAVIERDGYYFLDIKEYTVIRDQFSRTFQ